MRRNQPLEERDHFFSLPLGSPWAKERRGNALGIAFLCYSTYVVSTLSRPGRTQQRRNCSSSLADLPHGGGGANASGCQGCICLSRSCRWLSKELVSDPSLEHATVGFGLVACTTGAGKAINGEESDAEGGGGRVRGRTQRVVHSKPSRERCNDKP